MPPARALTSCGRDVDPLIASCTIRSFTKGPNVRPRAGIGILAGCLVLATPCVDADAQCTIDPPFSISGGVSANPPGGLGQSFMACQTGVVTRISFSVLEPSSGPVRLGLQAGTDLSAPRYSQSVNLDGGSNTIVLDTPFRVTEGTVYSFGLLPTAGTIAVLYDDDGPLTEGSIIQSSPAISGPRRGDLIFRVEIEPRDPRPTTPCTWGAVKELFR
jgi:hypothetical protein